MATEAYGGIIRSGVSGNYTYAVRGPYFGGPYTYADKPVVYVSWGDAARFANWLHNRQPTGAEDSTTTEDGVYTLSGATTSAQLAAVTRNPGAHWWLPSEDEWYKAAYHKNDGATGNYWEYPTHSDSIPDNHKPASDSGNSANFYKNGTSSGFTDLTFTNVGAYTLSASAYGTFDQGGNVSEWNETPFDGIYRGYRGGSWLSQYYSLSAGFWDYDAPTTQNNLYGFRVATNTVPEPASVSAAWLAGALLMAFRIRR
jgi:formylglycine-generating enzyme required for sulfatase activity